MLHRKDRADFAVLGLLALAWGLVVAPVLHGLEHGHGHAHRHGAPVEAPQQAHGAGSVEHLLAMMDEAAPLVGPVLVAVALDAPRAAAPRLPARAAPWAPEQPQGP